MSGYDSNKNIGSSPKTSTKQKAERIENALLKGSPNPNSSSTPKKGLVQQQEDLNKKKTNQNTGLAKAITELKNLLVSIKKILETKSSENNNISELKTSIENNTKALGNIQKNISEFLKKANTNKPFDSKQFIKDITDEFRNNVFGDLSTNLSNIGENISTLTESKQSISEDVLKNSLSEFKDMLTNVFSSQNTSKDYSDLFNQSLSKLDQMATNLNSYNSNLQNQFNKLTESTTANQETFKSLLGSIDKLSTSKSQSNVDEKLNQIQQQLQQQSQDINNVKESVATQQQNISNKETQIATKQPTQQPVINPEDIKKISESTEANSKQFASLKESLNKEQQPIISDQFKKDIQTYMNNQSEILKNYTEKITPDELEEYKDKTFQYYNDNKTFSEELLNIQKQTKTQQDNLLNGLDNIANKEESQKKNIQDTKDKLDKQIQEKTKQETKTPTTKNSQKEKQAIDQMAKSISITPKKDQEEKYKVNSVPNNMNISVTAPKQESNTPNLNIKKQQKPKEPLQGNINSMKPGTFTMLNNISPLTNNITDRNMRNNINRASMNSIMNNRMMQQLNQNMEQIKYNTNQINNRHLPSLTDITRSSLQNKKSSGYEFPDQSSSQKNKEQKKSGWDFSQSQSSQKDDKKKQPEDESFLERMKRILLTNTETKYSAGRYGKDTNGSYGIGYRLGSWVKGKLKSPFSSLLPKSPLTGALTSRNKSPHNNYGGSYGIGNKISGLVPIGGLGKIGKTKSPITNMLPKPLGFIGGMVGNIFGKLKGGSKKPKAPIPLVRVSTVDFVRRVGSIGGMSGMSGKLSEMIDQNDALRKVTRNANKQSLEGLRNLKFPSPTGGGGMPDVSKIKDVIGGKGGLQLNPAKLKNLVGKNLLKSGAKSAIGGVSLGGALAGATIAAAVGTAAWGAAHAKDYAKESGARFDGSAMDYVNGAGAKFTHVFGLGALQRTKAALLTGDVGRLVGVGNEYGDDFNAADYYALNQGQSRESILARKRKKVQQKLANEYMEKTDSGRQLKITEKLDKEIQQQNKKVMDKISKRFTDKGITGDKGNAIAAPTNVLDMTSEFANNLTLEQSGALQANIAQQKKGAQRNIEVLKKDLGQGYDATKDDKTPQELRKHVQGFLKWEQDNNGGFDIYGTIKQGMKKKPNGEFQRPLNVTLNRLKNMYRMLEGDQATLALSGQIQKYESEADVGLFGFWGSDYSKITLGVKRYLASQIKMFEELIKNQDNVKKADAAANKLRTADLLNHERNRRAKEAKESGKKELTKEEIAAQFKAQQTQKLKGSMIPLPNKATPSVQDKAQKQVQQVKQNIEQQTRVNKKGDVTIINHNNNSSSTSNSQAVAYNNGGGKQRGPAVQPNKS